MGLEKNAATLPKAQGTGSSPSRVDAKMDEIQICPGTDRGGGKCGAGGAGTKNRPREVQPATCLEPSHHSVESSQLPAFR